MNGFWAMVEINPRNPRASFGAERFGAERPPLLPRMRGLVVLRAPAVLELDTVGIRLR